MCCIICDPKNKYSKCICPPSWTTFENTLKKIKDTSGEFLSESLRISTITLCCNFNTSIDFSKLCIEYPPKNQGQFYNSFIFNWHTKYQYKTLVSVKIFPNGKVQIAGVNSIKSCAYIIRKIHNKISNFCSPEPKITNLNIAMINSDFKLTKILNLINMCEILSKQNIQSGGNFSSIIYQPIKYPAINSKFITDNNIQSFHEHIYQHSHKKKFKKNISILIFRSGSIIITGGNDIDDYYETYMYILNLIKTNSKSIII